MSQRPLTEQKLNELLRDLTCHCLQVGPEQARAEATWHSLAVDDADLLALVLLVETALDIELDERSVAACENLGQAAALVKQMVLIQ